MKKIKCKKVLILSHYLRNLDCRVPNHYYNTIAHSQIDVALVAITNSTNCNNRLFFISKENLYNYNKGMSTWHIWI